MKSAGIIMLLCSLVLVQDTTRQQERDRMVSKQIEARGVSDGKTLSAMRKVQRHRFVPTSQSSYAYDDRPLPIGHGQTISQPFIVAYMTAQLNLKRDSKVLEIGTGSGYQAAILSVIADSVFTIEIIEELGKTAKQRFNKLDYENIYVKLDDGYHGWKEHSPFDAIIVTAAAGHIPPPLIDQLAEGGRMIIPVGAPLSTQQLMLVTKSKGGKIRTESLMPVIFVPFRRK